MTDYYVITCFMSINSSRGVREDYWNRMVRWWTKSDKVHVEAYFGHHNDTWRVTRYDLGGFYTGKQYGNAGWSTYRMDLGPARYAALRRALAAYNGYEFDEPALRWFPLFPSGCCTRTNRGFTMCSHAIADAYSDEEVGILPDRDEIMPFTRHTPGSLFELISPLRDMRPNVAPPVVIAREAAAISPAALLAAKRTMGGG